MITYLLLFYHNSRRKTTLVVCSSNKLTIKKGLVDTTSANPSILILAPTPLLHSGNCQSFFLGRSHNISCLKSPYLDFACNVLHA